MFKKEEIFTVPNLLSCVRLLLIPVILWLYCEKAAYGWALAVLILSGITDVADGMIARKWNLVSNFGKALDPVADKLTQMAILWCLLQRFSHLWVMLAVLLVKETVTGIMSLYAVKRSGQVDGADWHGKICTALLYTVMGLHILWAGIPTWLSVMLMVLCLTVMLFSGLMYWYRNLKRIKGYA